MRFRFSVIIGRFMVLLDHPVDRIHNEVAVHCPPENMAVSDRDAANERDAASGTVHNHQEWRAIHDSYRPMEDPYLIQIFRGLRCFASSAQMIECVAG